MIDALLAAARRVADPDDALGREARARLPEASGLSPAGVELALSTHLETEASPAERAALQRWAHPAARCHVVLAANVCTAALRALVCAAATSARVVVKPSSRDPVLAELLVRALAPSFDIVLAQQLQARSGDEVHFYGSDAALKAIRARLPTGVRMRGHGSGLGVAAARDVADAAALARDLVAFDGKGCLSPRVILARDARGFAAALHRELERSDVPRGPLTPEDRGALAQARRTYQAIGEVHEGRDHWLGVDPAPVAIAPPPPLRAACVLEAKPALIASIAAQVTIVGGEGELADAIAARCPNARRARLGEMQRPPLDGPVDLR